MRYRSRQTLTVDFWPAFTDAFLSVILVLVFLVTIFLITQTDLLNSIGNLSERLAALESALRVSSTDAALLRAELDATNQRLQEASDALDAARADLAGTKTELDGTRTHLADARADLTETQAGLASTQADLDKTRSDLAQSQSERDAARKREQEQTVALAASAEQVSRLSKQLAEYLAQIKLLTKQLSDTKTDLAEKTASIGDLNASVAELSRQVATLTAQLAEARETATTQDLKLSKLLAEIEKRNKEIERLRDFEKYRSDFLARLSDVFGGVDHIRATGDRFIFQSEVLFLSGSADLSADGKERLTSFVEIFKALESRIPQDVGFNIQIQGHTDTDPIVRANYSSNWELSTARATRVVRFLARAGIPADLLSAAGYSQYYPAVEGDTPTAKNQNRRIEIFFTRR